jgi:hypothetical protein
VTEEVDARLRAEAAEIERLLDELRALVAAAAWQRIEDVIRRVVALYGAGLARALDAGRQAGASEAALGERIVADDLLGSLLVLHGLHPLTVAQRIDRALARVRGELGLGDGQLVMTELCDGELRLRASSALGGGAMSARVAEAVIRRTLEAAAPELTTIQIATPPPRDVGLVQIRPRGGGR